MMTESIGTLLAVDDEPEIRNLTAEFAKSWGFKVLLAEDGEAAIDILKNQKPDVIISDMAMPIKDGFTLAEGIERPQPNAVWQTLLQDLIINVGSCRMANPAARPDH